MSKRKVKYRGELLAQGENPVAYLSPA